MCVQGAPGRRLAGGFQENKRIRNKPKYVSLETRKDGVKFTTEVSSVLGEAIALTYFTPSKQLRSSSETFMALQRSYEKKQRHLEEKVIEIAGKL